MRRILSSSFIRLTRVCSRPAVSTSTGSRPCALPDAIASNTTAAGSAPSRARTMSTPARRAQISSCSTAAARNVSAAQISGCLPSRLQQVRQLADRRRLAGAVDADDQRHAAAACRSATGASTRVEDVADLLLDQIAQARAVARRAPSTAAMIRSVAATPMSAEISSSSSASIVSTSIGRDAPLGLVGAADDLVEALDDLLLGAREAFADPAEETHHGILSGRGLRPCMRLRFRALRPQHQRLDRRADVRRPSSTAAICVAIGSSTPWRAPSASAAPVVLHAFGDHLHAGQDLVRAAAARQLDADVPVAAQVPVQVSTSRPARSARPASRAGRRRRTPAA